MYDFFGIIIDQLGETFKWFLTGFFLMIVILILLYKNNLLSKTGPLSFVKKVSYYLFFPLYIGIVCWFFSATLIVETKTKELARITIQKAEESIFPQFTTYILSLAQNYANVEFNTKEELVTSYLSKYNFEKEDYSTQAMQWTLVNGLEYIENKAIENGSLQLGNENINFPQLISNYLNDESDKSSSPFGFLAGMSISTIGNYARSFYFTFVMMVLIVVIILSLDMYFTLKGRKKNKEDKNFVNPSTTLNNNQQKLENTTPELEGTKRIK